MTLYVATTNPGKLRDFAASAESFGVDLQPLPGLRDMPEPVEDGNTFEANARKKAEHYSRFEPGLFILADDSGLEVDALQGAPGVRSARFAEDAHFLGAEGASTDERNNSLLLEHLHDIRVPHSTGVSQPVGWGATNSARYRAVLAIARDGVVTHTAEGTVEGAILGEPRGTGGFGYDPLFYLPQLGKTMAEIDLATKQQISHRGNALRKLLQGMDIFHLSRFVSAQDAPAYGGMTVYETAVQELQQGRKQSHWIWFIFPQIAGLGSSPTSVEFAIHNAAEAQAYLAHEILGLRLRRVCEIIAELDQPMDDVFGALDAMKLRSSMTLFASVGEDDDIFHRVLENHFHGHADERTLALLGRTQ
jgi:XTP/dITP diphosphohydrolase